MTDDIFDVASPVDTPNGKTMWMRLGRAFKGDRDSTYLFKLSLLALPVTALSGEPVELFVFKRPSEKPAEYDKKPKSYTSEPPPHDDGDVPF